MMPRKKALFSSQNRLQPSDEGIARKQAGKPVMFRPALQVPVRQTQPPCQRIPLAASQKSLYPQPAVEIMGAKAGDAEHGYMDRVEPCQGWGLRMKSDEDMQKATGLRDNNHPPEPFGQKLRRGGKHDGENDAHAVRVRRVASIPSIWMPASSITGYGPCYAGLHVLQQRPPPHTLFSLPDKHISRRTRSRMGWRTKKAQR